MKTDKKDLIHKILKNSVYRVNSGLYQQLLKRLQKLSTSDLSNLNLIVGIKLEDRSAAHGYARKSQS